MGKWRYFTNLKLAAIGMIPRVRFPCPRGSVNKKDQSELEQKPREMGCVTEVGCAVNTGDFLDLWIFGSLKIAGHCGMTLGITLYHTLCQSRSIYITRYHPFGSSWKFGNTPKTPMHWASHFGISPNGSVNPMKVSWECWDQICRTETVEATQICRFQSFQSSQSFQSFHLYFPGLSQSYPCPGFDELQEKDHCVHREQRLLGTLRPSQWVIWSAARQPFDVGDSTSLDSTAEPRCECEPLTDLLITY